MTEIQDKVTSEVSSVDFTDRFWHLNEKYMGCVVHTYLKHVLRIRGYDNAACIGTLTTNDIQGVQEFIRTKLQKTPANDDDRKNYFHSTQQKSDEFEIFPGHVKLLEKIVDYINSMTELHGPAYFDPRIEKNTRKPDGLKGTAIRKNYVRGELIFIFQNFRHHQILKLL